MSENGKPEEEVNWASVIASVLSALEKEGLESFTKSIIAIKKSGHEAEMEKIREQNALIEHQANRKTEMEVKRFSTRERRMWVATIVKGITLVIAVVAITGLSFRGTIPGNTSGAVLIAVVAYIFGAHRRKE